MSLKRRFDRLQKVFRQLAELRQELEDQDRSGQRNYDKIMAHPEGPEILERFSQLVPVPFDGPSILANPEASDLACRILEIVAG